MMLISHLILMFSWVFIVISFSYEESYNFREKHYRSISGIIAHLQGEYWAFLTAWAVFNVYNITFERTRLVTVELLNSLYFCMATGIVSYNIIDYKYLHMMFFMLVILTLMILNMYLSYKFPPLRWPVLLLVLVSVVFLILMLSWPWSNFHTSVELLWMFVLYMNLVYVTWRLDQIQKYDHLSQYPVDSIAIVP